ncbi:hypothetical protein BC830DRAFT_1106372 [Chytriomyces sp. MP71]|nr:hypothetical protein BC830DRAFT_1106372 [Chytriomyces sp. MP71]
MNRAVEDNALCMDAHLDTTLDELEAIQLEIPLQPDKPAQLASSFDPIKQLHPASLTADILKHPLNSTTLSNILNHNLSLSTDTDLKDSCSETTLAGGNSSRSWNVQNNASTCATSTLKRYQPSPTPSSSNASVIASEEEEEGFEDVIFPTRIENLHFVGSSGAGKSSKAGSLSELEVVEDKIRQFRGSEDGIADDEEGFICLPDDFAWDKGSLQYRLAELEKTRDNTSAQDSGTRHNSPPQHQYSSALKGRNASLVMSKPMKSQDFGDGTELDDFDDLSDSSEGPLEPSLCPPNPTPPLKAWIEESLPKPVPILSVNPKDLMKPVSLSKSVETPALPTRQEALRKGAPVSTRPMIHSGLIGSSLRRSDSNLSRWTTSNAKAPPTQKKQRQKPTLIRNVNPSDIAHVVGTMKYDPILQTWTGNEEAILEFDATTAAAPLPSRPAMRPALIKNKSGLSSTAHMVGGMVFDPVAMCWKGNEEDVDVFAGIGEDEVVGRQEDHGNNVKYFVLTKAMKQSLYVAESTHKLFIGHWYPKAVQESKTLVRDTSKSHLYDVRHFTVKH